MDGTLPGLVSFAQPTVIGLLLSTAILGSVGLVASWKSLTLGFRRHDDLRLAGLESALASLREERVDDIYEEDSEEEEQAERHSRWEKAFAKYVEGDEDSASLAADHHGIDKAVLSMLVHAEALESEESRHDLRLLKAFQDLQHSVFQFKFSDHDLRLQEINEGVRRHLYYIGDEDLDRLKKRGLRIRFRKPKISFGSGPDIPVKRLQVGEE